MRKNSLALRVMSTAAFLAMVSSCMAPAFAKTYYLGDYEDKGELEIKVDADGRVTVNGNAQDDDDTEVTIKGGKSTDAINQPTTTETQEAPKDEAPVESEDPGAPEEDTQPPEDGEETPDPESKTEQPEGSDTDSEQPEADPEQQASAPEDEEEPEQQEQSAAAPQADADATTPAEGGDSTATTTGKRTAPDTSMNETTAKDAPSTPTSAATSTVIKVVNNLNKVVDGVKQAFKLTLENVNIVNDKNYDKAAMSVSGTGDTTIELNGNNVLENKYDSKNRQSNSHAALEKNGSDTGTLTITDTDDIDGEFSNRGSLTAKSAGGTGIGGGEGHSGENITIEGNAYVNATGYEVGIGGGSAGYSAGGDQSGNNITIGGNAYVVAKRTYAYGRAIGGGRGADNRNGDGNDIHITGNSTVYADGGIGGGQDANHHGGDAKNLKIDGNSTVYAYQNKPNYPGVSDPIEGGNIIGSNHGGETDVTITDHAKVKAWYLADYIGSGVGIGGYGGKTNVTISGNAIIGDDSASIGVSGGTLNGDPDFKTTITIGDNATVGTLNKEAVIGSKYYVGHSWDSKNSVDIILKNNAIVKRVSRIGIVQGKLTVKLLDNVTVDEITQGEYWRYNAIGSTYDPSEITLGGSSEPDKKQEGTVTVNATGGHSSTIGTGWGSSSKVKIEGNVDLTLKSANGKYIEKSDGTSYTADELENMLKDQKDSKITLVDQNGTVQRILHSSDLCKPAKNPITGEPELKEHKDPTCTTEGYNIFDCKYEALNGVTGHDHNDYKQIIPIDPNAHSWGNWTVTEPTCTTTGLKKRVCEYNSAHVDTETIPMKEHAYGDWTVTRKPTCMEEGEKERICTDCGHKDTAAIPVDSNAHRWGDDWTVTKEPTYDAPGEETRTCQNGCGETETREIPQLVRPAEENSSDGTTALELRVLDADKLDMPFAVSQSGAVRTYTASADTATLTGSMETLRYLKDHGAQTIVFVTNQQTTSFAIDDLLAQSSNGTFYLTHTGAEEAQMLVVE